MPINIPSGLYTGGRATFDTSPMTTAILKDLASQKAAKEAIVKNANNLYKQLNSVSITGATTDLGTFIYSFYNDGTLTRYHMGMVTDQGRVPTNPINCIVTLFPKPANVTDVTLSFAGVPFTGTQININIIQLPSTTITLASYTIQQGDTLQHVINNLLNQLVTQTGTYLIDALESLTLPDTLIISYFISFILYNKP